MSRLTTALLGLPPPAFTVGTEEIYTPMRDGTRLSSILYKPSPVGLDPTAPIPLMPTILVRTPYMKQLWDFVGKSFASQGYYVMIQDCRGRGKSEGTFDPLEGEDLDAQDTIRWIRRAPWFQQCPKLGMWGSSFVGILQYASICPEDPQAQPDALMPQHTASQFYNVMRPGHGFAMELFCRWHYVTHHLTATTTELQLARLSTKPLGFLKNAPLKKLDELITGSSEPTCNIGKHFFGHLNDPPTSEFWQKRSFRQKLSHAPPSHLLGGWFDIFLGDMFDDYETMRKAGVFPLMLTIGPWSHSDLHPFGHSIREGIRWYNRVLKGENGEPHENSNENGLNRTSSSNAAWGCSNQPCYDRNNEANRASLDSCNTSLGPAAISASSTPAGPNASSSPGDEPVGHSDEYPIKLFVMGKNEWRYFRQWPPESARPVPYYIHHRRRLSPAMPDVISPWSRYEYDPNDPTPRVGGALFEAGKSGRFCVFYAHLATFVLPSTFFVNSQNNAKLEKRADVLQFTTAPFRQAFEIIGKVTVRLYFQSSAEIPDFFVRLCVVTKFLKTSSNICDGYLRVPRTEGVVLADGVRCIEIDMWGTAFHFHRGQRMRLLIASGAHPRFRKSEGTDQLPLEDASGEEPKIKFTQWIYHDAAHPTCVILPVN